MNIVKFGYLVGSHSLSLFEYKKKTVRVDLVRCENSDVKIEITLKDFYNFEVWKSKVGKEVLELLRKIDVSDMKKYKFKGEKLEEYIQIIDDCDCKFKEVEKIEHRNESKAQCMNYKKVIGVTKGYICDENELVIGSTYSGIMNSIGVYSDIYNEDKSCLYKGVFSYIGSTICEHEKYNYENHKSYFVKKMDIGAKIYCEKCKMIVGTVFEYPIKTIDLKTNKTLSNIK